MSEDPDGRVVLVTGAAGPDTGQHVARRFAQDGATVIITDRSQRRLDAVAEVLNKEFPGLIHPRHLDLRQIAELPGIIADLESSVGSIDVLVNNAATGIVSDLCDTSVDQWDEIMTVDLKAPWLLAKSIGPSMKARRRGWIVNVTSIGAYESGWREGVYCSAKAALHSITRDLAHELGPFNIRCNSVAPGVIESWWYSTHTEMYASVLERTPLGSLPTPADVANVVAFLASEDARAITGQVINVSSGYHMTP